MYINTNEVIYGKKPYEKNKTGCVYLSMRHDFTAKDKQAEKQIKSEADPQVPLTETDSCTFT